MYKMLCLSCLSSNAIAFVKVSSSLTSMMQSTGGVSNVLKILMTGVDVAIAPLGERLHVKGKSEASIRGFTQLFRKEIKEDERLK